MSFSSIIYSAFSFAGRLLTGGGAGPQTVNPPFIPTTEVFYTHNVNSTYAITAGILTNTNIFFNSAISTTSPPLIVPLLVNNNTFSIHQISVGSVNLVAALFQNASTIYPPVVVVPSMLNPSYYLNTNVFYTADLTYIPPVFNNSNRLYDRDSEGLRSLDGGAFKYSYSLDRASPAQYFNLSYIGTYLVDRDNYILPGRVRTYEYSPTPRNRVFLVANKTLEVQTLVRNQ